MPRTFLENRCRVVYLETEITWASRAGQSLWSLYPLLRARVSSPLRAQLESWQMMCQKRQLIEFSKCLQEFPGKKKAWEIFHICMKFITRCSQCEPVFRWFCSDAILVCGLSKESPCWELCWPPSDALHHSQMNEPRNKWTRIFIEQFLFWSTSFLCYNELLKYLSSSATLSIFNSLAFLETFKNSYRLSHLEHRSKYTWTVGSLYLNSPYDVTFPIYLDTSSAYLIRDDNTPKLYKIYTA